MFSVATGWGRHDHVDTTIQEVPVKRTTKLLAGGALAVTAVAAGGVTIAVAQSRDDGPDRPITGPALARARAVALAHTGGGRVTGTEVGDEESYYEVEVTLADGRQIDVQLDRAFHVV